MYKDECWICGDTDHDADVHGEAIVILQPSLHSINDYVSLVIDVAEASGAPEAEDLRQAFDAPDVDADKPAGADYDDGSLFDEAVEAIENQGYCVVTEADSFLIYARVED